MSTFLTIAFGVFVPLLAAIPATLMSIDMVRGFKAGKTRTAVETIPFLLLMVGLSAGCVTIAFLQPWPSFL
jgi:hypothetical protein